MAGWNACAVVKKQVEKTVSLSINKGIKASVLENNRTVIKKDRNKKIIIILLFRPFLYIIYKTK